MTHWPLKVKVTGSVTSSRPHNQLQFVSTHLFQALLRIRYSRKGKTMASGHILLGLMAGPFRVVSGRAVQEPTYPVPECPNSE